MTIDNKPEVWLRGTLNNIPALLQPVAHALLQAREELNELMTNFPDTLLWHRVVGLASPGFHLQHLTGVLSRLFTYAKGEGLSQLQLDYLVVEGKSIDTVRTADLVESFNIQVDKALMQLSGIDETTLTAWCGVGRAQLPSTVIGLYVHAAEHTMRHLGQLLVTVKVLEQQENN
ncbi:DinB family protein [Mucilaginibacter sabulilitoris]|uniref:DinB family protein n=1 Tax=Mucilaginibacter sabulilitoris TaxID=1173583 RepID=A0ABZ0TFK1_9SPHI|nr:DinB family protein [Mucilaginibacter sabulilitoris]WPU91768.1 DinB family protein [Mucilaginibacter sabulilitoris]